MLRLIRHAQSEYNGSGKLNKDVGLSTDGINQCKHLDGTYDLVICSTLKRTRQTLDNSNIQYSNIIFTDLCREHVNGNPVNYYNNEEIVEETDEHFANRIEKFKEMLKELQQKFNRIVVITHHDFLYKMTGHYFGNAQWWDHLKL